MSKLISINPAKNQEVVGEVNVSTDAEIKEKVRLTDKAKLDWKELGTKKRIELLKPVYEEFKKRKDEISSLITKEMGKPVSESIDEVEEALTNFEWLLDNGEEVLADEVTHEDGKSRHMIIYEPYGTTAVITPWNFPFIIFIDGVISNLIAGNTVVFKISEECPLIGKKIEGVMKSKNLPEGVFSEVYGDGKVGQKLAESDVDLIWFTGSTKVGNLLYRIAANKFIKVILELGGSSPAIVFEDADISDSVSDIYSSRFLNCGQVCDVTKRLIVHESMFDKIIEKLKEEVAKKIIGDPSDKRTQIGPLVAKRQLELLENQVKDAVEKGAKIITGGKRPKRLNGVFYEPTILTNITKDTRVWKEEVFGPVLPIVIFKTEEEAIELANDTPYGLGSKVYSRNIERARRVASRIEAGSVEINGANRWLMCNPFGGYKQSGMGRTRGIIGLRELCQVKVISE